MSQTDVLQKPDTDTQSNMLSTSEHKSNVTKHFVCKLTWLVLGGDPVARSHRVEQFTAL